MTQVCPKVDGLKLGLFEMTYTEFCPLCLIVARYFLCDGSFIFLTHCERRRKWSGSSVSHVRDEKHQHDRD